MKYLYHLLYLVIILTVADFSLASNELNPKKLKGQEVKFDYKGHPKERKILYKYYKSQEDPKDNPTPIKKEQIGIYLYDINGDGKKEAIVYLENSGWCGSAGCKFHIFKPIMENKKLKVIVEGQAHEDIKILTSKTLGYQDLLLTYHYQTPAVIWKWNGKNYKVFRIFEREEYDLLE